MPDPQPEADMNLTTLLDAWLPTLGQLNPLQQQALHYLQTLGLPTRSAEHWKYTDVQRFLTERLTSTATNSPYPLANVQQASQFLQQLNTHTGLDASWQPRVLTTADFRDGIDALH